MSDHAKGKATGFLSTVLSFPPSLLTMWGAMIALGIIARWYTIVHAASWWFDESLSYSFAKVPILQSWQYLKYENNPPLYFWILRGWGLIFGFGELPSRLLSVLLGVFAFIAFIYLASELFDRTTGIWAGAIYAVASLAIFWDTEARMYSLLALLTSLAYIYFLKILFKKARWIDVAIWIVVVALSFYTNITALWIPLSELAMVLLVRPTHAKRWKVVMGIIAPIILFLPWLFLFIRDRFAFSQSIAWGSWHYFSHRIFFSALFTEPTSFFNFWSLVDATALALSFFGSFVVMIWFVAYLWKHRHALNGRFVFVGVGLFVPLLISALTIDLGTSRYYLSSALFFWMVMAYGIKIVWERARSKLSFMVLIFCIGAYAIFNVQPAFRYAEHGNWDDAARWIDEQHPDLVLAMPKMWAAEVYGPSSPFLFLPPPIVPLENSSLDPLQMVTRYNYNWGSVDYALSPEESTVLAAEIGQATKGTSAVAFGYQGSEAENTVMADLEALGFREGNAFTVGGYIPEVIVMFDRTPGIH
jgi:4-amino-4-deoxy-L-arabinose transferase-like glycosyltransferase